MLRDIEYNEDNHRDDHRDDHVDDKIIEILDINNPKSFFLFAGAGSGKTSSLVKVLSSLQEDYGEIFSIQDKKIAVITYTNAACEEIQRRLKYNSLFHVSTIHSFVWNIINGFDTDIKNWLEERIQDEITDTQIKEGKGKKGTQASKKRIRKIEKGKERLLGLEEIKRFRYSPSGNNVGVDSLNHAEVIQLGTCFIKEKELMQKILVNKFPILLIDESQDTNKDLMEALLKVSEDYKKAFSMGLFGDMMQRIYQDGKSDLAQCIPTEWEKPVKEMNHRCPARIVKLINQIRLDVDGIQQRARIDKEEGCVRIFICPHDVNKEENENKVANKMASITGNTGWSIQKSDFQSLILEHHMAAKRLGFDQLYERLHAIEKFRTGLVDGTIPIMRLYTHLVLPVMKALEDGDKFEVARILKKNSPILEATEEKLGVECFQEASRAVKKLHDLWDEFADPSCMQILNVISETSMFKIHKELQGITIDAEIEDSDMLLSDIKEKIKNALEVPFSEIKKYNDYIMGKTKFSTHQGVKGLEYPRVMLIIDDKAAKGFMFTYEKLFGAKEETKTDIENNAIGKETGTDRTKRLFYVACSRAEESLAVVAYSSNPSAVKKTLIEQSWFSEDEIEML